MKRIFAIRSFFFAFLILCVQNPTSAHVDTLFRLNERLNKQDSVAAINVFAHFTWEVNARLENGSTVKYITTKPDTLKKTHGYDTVRFTSSFYVAPELTGKVLALRYELEGSVRVLRNGQLLLATGVFQNDSRSGRQNMFQDNYVCLTVSDSIQTLDITYLPLPNTDIISLEMKMTWPHLAERHMVSVREEELDSRGKGFYYFAFGIVFLGLYVFFRERTEHLYFSLFCIFAALAYLWDILETNVLYNLELFFVVFSFEFLSNFFCRILKNKEKSKVPLLVIVTMMALCFLPSIRYSTLPLITTNVPVFIGIISTSLLIYAVVSTIYYLFHGFGQKRWEAKAILAFCLVPILLFVLFLVIYAVIVANRPGEINTNVKFSNYIDYFLSLIVYAYPLAAVYILSRRNGMAQRQLMAQVLSIQRLSEENLAKEQEKKHILENQKEELENEVAVRTAEIVSQKEEIEKQHDELKIEKKKSDDLLRNILPEEVAQELKDKGFSEAKLFDNVTVLFADFVDFTKAGEAMQPQELVNELHICFKTFDEIISRHGIEKIKTIGDAYLAVSGLPAADTRHAENIVSAAIEINRFMGQRQQELGNRSFRVRIGIHSGSVVAGIVGVKKFAYDIWGDTVNTAARMEQRSEPGKINISQTTYELVKDKFTCEYRGEIDAKNKGMLKMYFVQTGI